MNTQMHVIALLAKYIVSIYSLLDDSVTRRFYSLRSLLDFSASPYIILADVLYYRYIYAL